MDCHRSLLPILNFRLNTIGVLFAVCAWLVSINGFATSQDRLSKQAQGKFAEVSQSYYQQAASELKGTIFIKNDIDALRQQVERLYQARNKTLSIAMIIANLDVIFSNIDTQHSAYFMAKLLENKAVKSASSIYSRALDSADSLTISYLHYQWAKYYFESDNLTKTFEHLSAIESSDVLSEKERDYATLMFGIALQKQKKHRESLKFYKRISKNSPYYSYAQLNAAVANIRQGWWTDAHVAIESALKENPPEAVKVTNDRLLMVLGYSQLQNEFYRNARLAFRKLTLDSPYVNQALLGIGLCAIQQKDYSGALNALNRLQSTKTDELSVMESYMLIPFTYERMGEFDNASIHYSKAIAFYENKLRFLEQEYLRYHTSTLHDLPQEWLKKLSDEPVRKYRLLKRFEKSPSTQALSSEITSLRAMISRELTQLLSENIRGEINIVKSYMSQSQYGLAKLYDNQQ